MSVRITSLSVNGNMSLSKLITMFWILKSLNLVGNPNFCTILAYFLAANLESSSDFAPVHTILPKYLFLIKDSERKEQQSSKMYNSKPIQISLLIMGCLAIGHELAYFNASWFLVCLINCFHHLKMFYYCIFRAGISICDKLRILDFQPGEHSLDLNI